VKLCGLIALLCPLLPGCSEETYIHLLRPSPTDGTGGGEATGGTSSSGGQADLGGAGGQPESALIHRYDFEGTGTVVLDRVSNMHGEIRGGAELDGVGSVVLDGSDHYVALPSGLISGLNAVTFAAWLEWQSVPARCWQRILDFGNNDSMEVDGAGNVTSSIFVTPSNCSHNVLTAVVDFVDSQETIRALEPLPADAVSFVALVYDEPNGRFELFYDGDLVASAVPGRRLSEIDDVNNWLGRSQWIQDQIVFLRARYLEFRIYDRGLSIGEISEMAERGPEQP
jgi:hypothetical protein